MNWFKSLFRAKQATCPGCGAVLPVPSSKVGRIRTYCSDKCRKRTERRRRKENAHKNVTPTQGNSKNFRDLSARVEVLEKDREEIWKAMGSIMDLLESGEESE